MQTCQEFGLDEMSAPVWLVEMVEAFHANRANNRLRVPFRHGFEGPICHEALCGIAGLSIVADSFVGVRDNLECFRYSAIEEVVVLSREALQMVASSPEATFG